MLYRLRNDITINSHSNYFTIRIGLSIIKLGEKYIPNYYG